MPPACWFSPTGRGMTNPFDSTAAQLGLRPGGSRPARATDNAPRATSISFLPLKSPTRTRGVLAVKGPSEHATLFIPEQRQPVRDLRGHSWPLRWRRVHYYVDGRRAMALLMAGPCRAGEVELELSRQLLGAGGRGGANQVPGDHSSAKVPRHHRGPRGRAPLSQATRRCCSAWFPQPHRQTSPSTRRPARHVHDLRRAIRRQRRDRRRGPTGRGCPRGRERRSVSNPFARGGAAIPRGVARALGLAISRAIVQAHGRRDPRRERPVSAGTPHHRQAAAQAPPLEEARASQDRIHVAAFGVS